jgi:hypothetical protein
MNFPMLQRAWVCYEHIMKLWSGAVMILLVGVLMGCATATKQNPDPIPRVEYERTSRLLELRESLDRKNAAYQIRTGDRLNPNTNKREFGKLEDEYANWDRRAQAQIERELIRRYQSGETRAYFPGMEVAIPGATAPSVITPQP